MSEPQTQRAIFEDQVAPYLESSADIEGQYRYRLGRAWGDPAERVCWIMLNPSTADAEVNDPTIRRCIALSRSWGFGALVVVNLFALRATDPRALRTHGAPIGPRNDEAILDETARAGQVIAAWGTHGWVLGRHGHIRKTLARHLFHLGLTKGGFPRHPLYLRGDVKPERWESR
jgi:hypothetical protein